MYNKTIDINTEIDIKADFVSRESRVVEHRIFGIRIAKYTLVRNNNRFNAYEESAPIGFKQVEYENNGSN